MSNKNNDEIIVRFRMTIEQLISYITESSKKLNLDVKEAHEKNETRIKTN